MENKLPLIQHKQTLNQIASLERSVVTALDGVVRFLDGKTTKTEVVNQLKEIGTPDALKVVEAVDEMHTTLKAHKNTDLTEVTKLLKQLIDQASKPIEFPDQLDTVKVSNLSEIDFSSLEKAIKAIKVTPKVEVKSPDVKIEKPDLSPLEKSLEAVVSAIKAIAFPEFPKTDLTGLEEQVETTNKKLDTANEKLQKLIDKPTGGKGSTGASFVNAAGNLVYPVVNTEGRFDTTSESGSVFLGKAMPGSSESEAVWQIVKVNTTSGVKTYADDDVNFTKTWDDRTSYSY
jgi:hypothetical protein